MEKFHIRPVHRHSIIVSLSLSEVLTDGHVQTPSKGSSSEFRLEETAHAPHICLGSMSTLHDQRNTQTALRSLHRATKTTVASVGLRWLARACFSSSISTV